MDRAEYVFYKFAQGSGGKFVPTENYSTTKLTFDPAGTLTHIDGTQINPGGSGSSTNTSNARVFGKEGPNKIKLTGKDNLGNVTYNVLKGTVESTPAFPNANLLTYNPYDQSRVAQQHIKSDPSAIPSYTGKSFSEVFKRARTDGNIAFKWNKGDRTDSDSNDMKNYYVVAPGPNTKVPETMSVNLPKYTYQMPEVDVPEESKKDVFNPEIGKWENDPTSSRRWNPSTSKVVGDEKTKFSIHDLANLATGATRHLDAYQSALDRITGESTGYAALGTGGLTTSNQKTGKNVGTDRKYVDIPWDVISQGPNAVRDKMLTTLGSDYENYVQQINNDKNLTKEQKQWLLRDAEQTHSGMSRLIKSDEGFKQFYWNPNERGSFIPDADKALKIIDFYKNQNNPEANKSFDRNNPQDWANKITAENWKVIGDRSFNFGDLIRGGGFNPGVNVGGSATKGAVQKLLGLTNDLGIHSFVPTAATTLLGTSLNELTTGKAPNTWKDYNTEEQQRAQENVNKILSTEVPANIRSEVGKRLRENTQNLRWNEGKYGPFPKTQKELEDLERRLRESAAFQNL